MEDAQLPGPVHPERPEIDGFCFDETAGLALNGINAMLSTGQVFLTQFRATNQAGEVHTYGGSLIAIDFEDARQEAQRRGLGETVSGVLREVVRL